MVRCGRVGDIVRRRTLEGRNGSMDDERRTGTDCRRNKLELANGKKMAEGCNV